MRSIDEDLTARARIRDAALELFGEKGYAATSIREVARVAGVSAGLVQHHFGSKAGLRAACDAHALEVQRVNVARKLERQEYDAAFIGSLYASGEPIVRYLVRGLTEGWPGAEKLFDQAAEQTETWLAQTWPERFPGGSDAARAAAATMVAMNLGTLVLHSQLGRWLGVDPLEKGRQHVAAGAMIEIYRSMGEFFGSNAGRNIRDALADYEASLRQPPVQDRDD